MIAMIHWTTQSKYLVIDQEVHLLLTQMFSNCESCLLSGDIYNIVDKYVHMYTCAIYIYIYGCLSRHFSLMPTWIHATQIACTSKLHVHMCMNVCMYASLRLFAVWIINYAQTYVATDRQQSNEILNQHPCKRVSINSTCIYSHIHIIYDLMYVCV